MGSKNGIYVWYHLIDVTIVNIWSLYRRVELGSGRTPTKSLFDFRVEVATSLTKIGEVVTPKRCGPSVENEINKKKASS